MAIEVRDGVEGKVCSTCKVWRPLAAFNHYRLSNDGYQPRCSRCPARVCKDCGVKATDCADFGGPLDRAFGGHKSYCKACKVEVIKKYNHNTGPGQKYYSTAQAARKRRRARVRAAEGHHTVEETTLLKLIYGSTCPACNERQVEHVDHVVPLAGGRNPRWDGTDWVQNLQWLCGPCNLAKSDFNAEDYRPDRGQAAHYLWMLGIWKERSARKRDAYARELALRIKTALKLGRPAIVALKTMQPIDQWTPKTTALK